nr:immunoglobulin heavy chain junction region [Macaca mulatta]MOW33484.1 immunoglobulin heavy chain junction region [Macaca mulatta]MOW33581.1 immunoglobulin heavy chain junction region [Macaca mulatta]
CARETAYYSGSYYFDFW